MKSSTPKGSKLNVLIIRKEKIDWLNIIDMVFKRKNWGKVYTLFTCETTTVSCVMREFNFEEATAWFRLKVEFRTKLKTYSYTDDIRYALNNFTLNDFKMHLNKKLISLLEFSLTSHTKYIAESKYYDLRTFAWNITDERIIKAGLKKDLDVLDGIADEELQSKCIYKLETRAAEILNEEYDDKVSEYISLYPFKNHGIDLILQEIKSILQVLPKA